MSARESAAVERAAAAVQAGMTIAEAARTYGVNRSSIHRALNRRVTVPPTYAATDPYAADASPSPLGGAVGPRHVSGGL